MVSPQLATCLNVNFAVDSYHLLKLFLLKQEKLSKLIEVITNIIVMVCQGINLNIKLPKEDW